jgi:hypothetical protein
LRSTGNSNNVVLLLVCSFSSFRQRTNLLLPGSTSASYQPCQLRLERGVLKWNQLKILRLVTPLTLRLLTLQLLIIENVSLVQRMCASIAKESHSKNVIKAQRWTPKAPATALMFLLYRIAKK